MISELLDALGWDAVMLYTGFGFAFFGLSAVFDKKPRHEIPYFKITGWVFIIISALMSIYLLIKMT